jgi:hypothetical protein
MVGCGTRLGGSTWCSSRRPRDATGGRGGRGEVQSRKYHQIARLMPIKISISRRANRQRSRAPSATKKVQIMKRTFASGAFKTESCARRRCSERRRFGVYTPGRRPRAMRRFAPSAERPTRAPPPSTRRAARTPRALTWARNRRGLLQPRRGKGRGVSAPRRGGDRDPRSNAAR